VTSGTRRFGAMTCHSPGSASASSETGALRKSCFPAFSSPGCTHHHAFTREQALVLSLCVWIGERVEQR
jgi:hypothetical protein